MTSPFPHRMGGNFSPTRQLHHGTSIYRQEVCRLGRIDVRLGRLRGRGWCRDGEVVRFNTNFGL